MENLKFKHDSELQRKVLYDKVNEIIDKLNQLEQQQTRIDVITALAPLLTARKDITETILNMNTEYTYHQKRTDLYTAEIERIEKLILAIIGSRYIDTDENGETVVLEPVGTIIK